MLLIINEIINWSTPKDEFTYEKKERDVINTKNLNKENTKYSWLLLLNLKWLKIIRFITKLKTTIKQ